jgi:hypothetical protein
MVIFTGLGLVALALGLLVRRYSASAFTIGLIGILVLTTALTWMTYAGPELDAQPIDKRKVESAAVEAELRRTRERNQELEKRDEDHRAEIDLIQTKLAAAKNEHQEAQQRADEAKVDLNRLEAELQEAKERIAKLEKKGAEQLAERLDTPFYTSEPLEHRTFVCGLTGSWYIIRLKLQGKPFIFADGQFRMPEEAVKEIKESAGILQRDVLTPIERVAKRTRVFLRGGADPRPLTGTKESQQDFRELWVLPRKPDGTCTYKTDPQRRPQPIPIRNADLPNLRADRLRQYIQPVLVSADISLLENVPAPGQERTVDLFLYVEWPP